MVNIMNITEDHGEPVLRFVFNLLLRQNVFTLYLGGMFVGLYLVIFVVTLAKRRNFSVVTQVARPDKDSHVHEYVLLLKTSFLPGAGLTGGARVAVQLTGSFCDTKRFTLLRKVMRQRILSRAHADIFVLYAPMDIGQVQSVHITLFNLSGKKTASWRPCFIEVLKSTTRERWATHVREKMKTESIVKKSFDLVKGFRESPSFFKLVMEYHQWTSPFFHPQRFGSYTAFTNVLFFFFSQSTLMMATMCTFILAQEFLGTLTGDLSERIFENSFPVTQMTAAAVAAFLQKIELILHNIRPTPKQTRMRNWRGLWRNDYPADLMHCNVQFEWDKPPSEFSHMANRFSDKTSLSTIESSTESSLVPSDDESSGTEKRGMGRRATIAIVQPVPLNLLEYCIVLSKESYTKTSKSMVSEEKLSEYYFYYSQIVAWPIYMNEKTVLGTTMLRLTERGPRPRCQFCLWVKHLTVKGHTLQQYVSSLTRNMRRSIQSSKVLRNPGVLCKVTTICINQFVASLCSRLLKEAVETIEKEKLQLAGLNFLLDGLLFTKSNLWFSMVGHREGPYAGSKMGGNSHMISNIYFTMLREMVKTWKMKHRGTVPILKRSHEIFPTMKKTGKVRWQKTVQKHKIKKICDILAEMDNENPSPTDSETSMGSTMSNSSLIDRNYSRIIFPESTSKNEQELGVKVTMSSFQGTYPNILSHGLSSEQNSSDNMSQTGQPTEEPSRQLQSVRQRLEKAAAVNTCPVAEWKWNLEQNASSRINKKLGDQVGSRPLNVRTSHKRFIQQSSGSPDRQPGSDDTAEHATYTADGLHASECVGEAEPIVDTLSFWQPSVWQPVSPDLWQDSSQFSTAFNTLHHRYTTTDSTFIQAEEKINSSDCVKKAADSGPDCAKRSVDSGTIRQGYSSDHPHETALKDRCNSHTSESQEESSSQPQSKEPASSIGGSLWGRVFTTIKRERVQVPDVSGPVAALCSYFESYANPVEFEVTSPFETDRYLCCQETLCQIYAVIFSQLSKYAYDLVHQFLLPTFTKQSQVEKHDDKTAARDKDAIIRVINEFILRRSEVLQALGLPQNEEALTRIRTQMEVSVSDITAQPVIPQNRSGNNPEENVATSSPQEHRRKRFRYKGFKFGERQPNEGLVTQWTHVPYPFTKTLLPPIRLKWKTVKPLATKVDGTPGETDKLLQPSEVKLIVKDSADIGTGADEKLRPFLKRLFTLAVEELQNEAEWVLGLKESMALIIAQARMEVQEELEDPIKIAVRHFTHALIVLLFEELLPKPKEENFVVTPDDIRQRRKKLSSRRTPGLFDLTEVNSPGYDLNFLDFVVVNLCERWEMAKVEYQFQPTLKFLSRCLTMDNLDTKTMEQLEYVYLAQRKGTPMGLLMDRLTHIHETQHAIAVVVNEIMAVTLVYVVPETLKTIKYVNNWHWLKTEEERVAYVCEKVCVLEHQVRHALIRRVLEEASHEVQDKTFTLTRRKHRFVRRETRFTSRLRRLVAEDDYYTRTSQKQLQSIKHELKELRKILYTIDRVNTFQKCCEVSKYVKRTHKLQHIKVQNTLSALTDLRFQEAEYALHQYVEVEWVVTRQMEKKLPSVFMIVAMAIMFVGTLVNLFVIIVLGATFSPRQIGHWFGLHGLGLAMIILISEPFKCLWWVEFGWKQPEQRKKKPGVQKLERGSTSKLKQRSTKTDAELEIVPLKK